METILSVIQVAIAVILVFLVLMHSGKDSGLSGAFGVGSGAGPLGGGSMVERNLNRWTIFFAVLFFVNAICCSSAPGPEPRSGAASSERARSSSARTRRPVGRSSASSRSRISIASARSSPSIAS